MRIGQLPSVRELTPDITPLLQARQMKNQAYQNIAGTISQLAAQKQQKELDKQKKQQAIAAVTPFLESLKQMNPKLKNVNFSAADLVGAVGADKAMSQVQELMTAANNERNKAAELALKAKANEIRESEVLRAQEEAKIDAQKDIINKKRDSEISILQAAVVRKLGGSVDEFGEAPSDTLKGITPSVVYRAVQEEYESSPDKYQNVNTEDLSKMQSSVMDRLTGVAKETGEARKEQGAGEMSFQKLKDLYFEKKVNFLKGLDGTKETLNSQERIRRTANSLKTVLEQYIEEGSNQTIDQFIEAKFRGSEFRGLTARVKALAGQVGANQLIAMRRASKDGSSGFGQLTQQELNLLQNLFGALTDENGELVPANVLLDTVEEIEYVMENRMARTKRTARIEFGQLADSYGIDDFESFIVPDRREESQPPGGSSPDGEKIRFEFRNGQFYPMAFPKQ